MKRIALLLTLILASSHALAQTHGSEHRKEYEKEKNGPHGECRTEFRTLQRGLDYRTITCLGDEDDLDVHVVRVDPKRFRLDTAVFGGRTATSAARELDAPFVLNANFFDKARKPLGTIVTSSEVVRSSTKPSWQSVFLITENGNPYIVTADKWPSYRKRAWMAVQAGPRLVVNGRTNRVHQSYAAARAGVCIQWDGDILFFATPQNRKFDMYESARIARRGEIDGGLACKEAMLFDGGHSVNLFVDGDRRIVVEGDPVPVYVYARER